jgi:ParB family transcriptional regulator, chromosome partitioning protein
LAKTVLGRGIGAILDEVEEAYKNEMESNMEHILEIDISKIKPNPFQPRKEFDVNSLNELAKSVKKHGLLQPIVVAKHENEIILIAGERRLRASKLAGFKEIKVVMAVVDYSKLRELALMENIQRENLNPIELALSLKELLSEHNMTHELLSELIHKSRTYVTNLLRLLQLSDYTQSKISENKISVGHAKVLIGLDEKRERVIVDSIINQKLTVRETEALIKLSKESSTNNKSESLPKVEKYNFTAVEDIFENSPYKVKYKKNSIEISFSSQDEIESFLNTFNK